MREIKFRLIYKRNIAGYERHILVKQIIQGRELEIIQIQYSKDNKLWSTEYIPHNNKELLK